jgi:maleate isomerase
MQSGLEIAVRDVTTAEPDHLLIGVSALSFMGGIAGRESFEQFLGKITAVPVTTAAAAVTAALQQYGVRRIGVLSPHPPMMDQHYIQYFAEAGYEVSKLHRIDCPTTLAIAMVDDTTIQAALNELCDAGVEAVVQVGTDLIMAQLADEAERWLAKPVVAVNAAMLWHALRARSIEDRLFGFGSILREH